MQYRDDGTDLFFLVGNYENQSRTALGPRDYYILDLFLEMDI